MLDPSQPLVEARAKTKRDRRGVIDAYERYNLQCTLQQSLEFREAYTRHDEYERILGSVRVGESAIAPAEEQVGGARYDGPVRGGQAGVLAPAGGDGGAGGVLARPSAAGLLQAVTPSDDGIELDFTTKVCVCVGLVYHPLTGGDGRL